MADWQLLFIQIEYCRNAWQSFVCCPAFHDASVATFTLDRMFTGLVESQGSVRFLKQESEGLRFTIAPGGDCFVPQELSVGESISVSGCCLTVIQIDSGGIDFQAGEETLSRTNLGELAAGSRVNLERSLVVGDRLGGHFVQGHVDGTGAVDEIIRRDEWVDIRIRVSAQLTQLMVPKGPVAVDGVSLTLVDVEQNRFSVALIPHTLQATTLGSRQIGDRVNIELDILGKYVAKLVQGLHTS